MTNNREREDKYHHLSVDEAPEVELVGHTTQKRNWRGIAIALLVIVVVCALIITTIILLSPTSEDETPLRKFTFEDFITKKYQPKSFHPVWIKGEDSFFYRNEDGAVILYNCSTNSSSFFMDNTTFKDLDASSYTVSPNNKYVLLPYNVEKIYRHSTRAKYKIYNVETKGTEALQGPDGDELQYVSWAPSGESLVFVQSNNIFYKKRALQSSYSQITDSGEMWQIFNGIPDWVYEEEIIQTNNAIWWSPTGRYFLYAVFNDSEVRRFDLTYYGEPNQQYLDSHPIAYPKAGTRNPTFRLMIYDTDNNVSTEIKPPNVFQNIDHYFTTVTWQNSDNVLISWLNRAQNVSILSICSVLSQKCKENYREESDSGWVDIMPPNLPYFTKDGSYYFLILPQKEGKHGSFNHIAMINASTSVDIAKQVYGSKVFVTTGLWDVEDIVGYDNANNTIYFLATKTGSPTSRHLFSTTTLRDDTAFLKPTCLSCSEGADCQWVGASFSSSAQNYMLNCLGPSVPTYTLLSASNGVLSAFEDNAKLKSDLEKLSLPRIKYIHIPLTSSLSMWGKLLLPKVLKEDEIIKYNFLMSVYGGPNSQKVTQQFKLGWEEYLASSHNIIIGYADGRGGGGRGNRWLHANYRKLGTTEVQDTITAGQYFKDLTYVSETTAIWGWSYGGFLTASVLGQQSSDVFKCGVSVAPVTDWRYYDSVYTERYMGLPVVEDNLEGYKFANVSRNIENFKKSKFMVVHGTGDDNVHFQNTAQLTRALTNADIYYRVQVYTDQQHSLDGGNTRKHLYNSLEDFLLQCYGEKSQTDTHNQESSEKDADEHES